jgi:hypothetical protein
MTAYNGQSDPRLQAIAEAERERFRTGNGQGNGHARLNEDEPLLCEQLVPLSINSIPPRPWAYGHFLLFGHAAVIGAVDGGGKGALAVVMALSMITGLPLLGERVWRTGLVAIVSFEDDKIEWLRRIAAACMHYKLDYRSICGSFYFITRPRGRVTLAAHLAIGRGAVVFPDGDAIVAHLKAIGAVLLIVDPFNHAHALDDGNSNVMIAKLAGEIARIAAESMVAALVLHHLRKGSNGSADDLMGATALRATFRSARILMRMTKEEAEDLEVSPEDIWRYTRIASSKENYAPPPDLATWYQFKSVELGNGAGIYVDGDNVQVLAAWTPPSAFDDLSKAQIAEIFDALRTGPETNEFYLCDPRANGAWAGWPIAKISNKAKGEAKRILRTWFNNGVLLEEEYYSKKRQRATRRISVDEIKAAEILGPLYQPPLQAT